MRRRVVVAIAAGAVLSLTAIVALASPAEGGLNLVCPAVPAPVAGQTITCTYVAETPPTTTPPVTTTTELPPVTSTTTTPPVTTTTTAVTTTQVPTPGFPTAATTGVPSGVTPTPVSGDLTITTAGAVVDAKDVSGSVLVRANNVTIKNSRIRGAINNTGGTWAFTVTDSEIGGSGCDGTTNGGAAVGFENYTVLRSNIHGFADGPRVSGSNILVQDSFIVTCPVTNAHGDGIQGFYGGSNVKIYHNTIDARPSAPYVTSAVFIADNSTSADVRDNLLMGGGYVLRLHNDKNTAGSNWRASGNRIVSGSWVNGDTYNTNVCGKAGFVWSDNTLVTLTLGTYTVASTVGPMSC